MSMSPQSQLTFNKGSFSQFYLSNQIEIHNFCQLETITNYTHFIHTTKINETITTQNF